jgi:hypothetical protein
MQQSHCQLPWLGNLSSFAKASLPQHIQGVMLHGRKMILYRTFHTLSNTANQQIHTFLLTLERIIETEGQGKTIPFCSSFVECYFFWVLGKLPDTIYYQIDGGSENTAKAVLYICELLIIRRVTKKIVITRLIVGHTHCDVDAVFGRIWRRIRVIYYYC